MLTGQTPFAAETMNDSVAAILTREPAPLDGDTPAELQRIVRKSLQKHTDERYQTVKDLQLDLKNLKRELEFSQELERSQIPSHQDRQTSAAQDQLRTRPMFSQRRISRETASCLSVPVPNIWSER
jgi:serine/threonine protein kinase